MFKENNNLKIKKGNEPEEQNGKGIGRFDLDKGPEDPDFLSGLSAKGEKKAEEYFYKNGLVTEDQGKLEFDLDNIRNLKSSSLSSQGQTRYYYHGKRMVIDRKDIFNFLKDKSGFKKGDDQKNIKSFFSLPINKEAAKNGEFSEGLALPWEAIDSPDFREVFELSDGSEASMADLFYLKKIHDFKIHRNEQGELEYFDEDEGAFKKFTGKISSKIFGQSISFIEDDVKYRFTENPVTFLQKFLPLVDSLKIFNPDDFRRQSGSKDAETLFSHDRKISPTNPYVNISGETGLVRYYIGRNKIVGTERKINEETMTVRELDDGLMGIIEKVHGKTRLLYTFEKLNQAEYSQHDFQEKADSFRMIGGEEMKERIKEYKLSDYLPRRPEESPEDYANRLSTLNDIDFITNKFRDLVFKTGVPLRDLSWTEQVLISNYILESKNETELLSFIKEYGVAGLKSFIAVESDRSAGDKIINIGQSLEKKEALTVFQKIGRLNELAVKKSEELSQLFLKKPADIDKKEQPLSSFGNIYKYLLKKSGELVNGFDERLKNNVDTSSFLLELEKCRAEMIMLVAVLKELKSSDKNLDLETVKDLNLEIKDYGSPIIEEDKKEIRNISRSNWDGFGNPKMAEVVASGLEKSLIDDKKQKAYILKYKNEVIGFVRFEKTDQGTVYAGSFNVSKDLRGLSIGNEMMERALAVEGESNVLEASASIKIPAGCAYIEKIGFVADGLISNYHETGEDLFAIKMDKERNKGYRWRDEGKSEPISLKDLKASADDYHYLDSLIGRETIILHFDLRKEMGEYQAALRKLLPKVDDNLKPLEERQASYTLTRYFYDKEENPRGDIRYLVFEKKH